MIERSLERLMQDKAILDSVAEIQPPRYPALNFIEAWKKEVQAEIDKRNAESSIHHKFKVWEKVRCGGMEGWIRSIEDRSASDCFGIRFFVTVHFPIGELIFNNHTIKYLEKVES